MFHIVNMLLFPCFRKSAEHFDKSKLDLEEKNIFQYFLYFFTDLSMKETDEFLEYPYNTTFTM